jgi:hypothetical protein
VVGVRDTGPGIPASEQADLFTRFFRASNAVDRSVPGAGLGLAIAAAIIGNHGGEIALESREGKGTTVTVQIPRLGDRAYPGPPQRAGEDPRVRDWRLGRGAAVSSGAAAEGGGGPA